MSLDPDWEPVSHSSRITAEAYLADPGRILVRFTDGTEWWYEASVEEWDDFQAATSPGQYIADVLNHKDNGQFS